MVSVQDLIILLMVSVQVDGKRVGPDYTVDDERACLCVGC